MALIIDDELLRKITSLGTLDYNINKIINICDIEDADIQMFTKEFNTENSAIHRAYTKGKDKADYALDSRLFEMARNGNINAIKKYEQRKIRNKQIR